MVTPKKNRSVKQTNKMIKNLNNKISLINYKMKFLNKTQKRYLKCTSEVISLKNKIKELENAQHVHSTKKEKEILSNRNKVEDSYKNLKKSERIVIRKEHKIKNFMSFIYMDELKRITNKYSEIIIKNKFYDV